jgi:hypothetical protein
VWEVVSLVGVLGCGAGCDAGDLCRRCAMAACVVVGGM